MYEVQRPPPQFDPSETFDVVWQRGNLVAKGGFGEVYLGINLENGKLLAVKTVPLANTQEYTREVEIFRQEVALLRDLHHENVVQYFGMTVEEESLNIFLEYIPCGSISTLLKKFGKFNDTVLRVYTRQILTGLHYLHSNMIVHRDIKGANILVDNSGTLKLTDFGSSKRLQEVFAASFACPSIKGTPHWMAPECIQQQGYGRQADIWSLGCTVIEMATGRPPWSDITDQVAVMFHIATHKAPPAFPPGLSQHAYDFLNLCLQYNPRNRPNAARLLMHPFIPEARGSGSSSGGGSGDRRSMTQSGELRSPRGISVRSSSAALATSSESAAAPLPPQVSPPPPPPPPVPTPVKSPLVAPASVTSPQIAATSSPRVAAASPHVAATSPHVTATTPIVALPPAQFLPQMETPSQQPPPQQAPQQSGTPSRIRQGSLSKKLAAKTAAVAAATAAQQKARPSLGSPDESHPQPPSLAASAPSLPTPPEAGTPPRQSQDESIRQYLHEFTIAETERLLTPEQKAKLLQLWPQQLAAHAAAPTTGAAPPPSPRKASSSPSLSAQQPAAAHAAARPAAATGKGPGNGGGAGGQSASANESGSGNDGSGSGYAVRVWKEWETALHSRLLSHM